jgi:hypothetical protein
MNILKQLNKSTNLANESQVYSNYSQVVNNPYLKLFYQIMIEPDLQKVFEEYAKGIQVINIFDFVALACKYLSWNQFNAVMQIKIGNSIEQGNLDAIPLIGLLPQKPGMLRTVL